MSAPCENNGSKILLSSKIAGSRIMLWRTPADEIAIFTVDMLNKDISNRIPQLKSRYEAIPKRIIFELLLNPAG